MEQFTMSMEYSEEEFPNVTLLRMLLEETFIRSTFDTYAGNSWKIS